MVLSHKVKDLRTKAKMTQAQLAKRAGVTQAFISQLETGAAESLTLTTLRRIAKALQLTVAELMK
jgi:transcriptional regulator with XRE-family HTH domain